MTWLTFNMGRVVYLKTMRKSMNRPFRAINMGCKYYVKRLRCCLSCKLRSPRLPSRKLYESRGGKKAGVENDQELLTGLKG